MVLEMRKSHVYTDAFDFNASRSTSTGSMSSDTLRALFGRVRLDAILNEKMVLNDVQLFHSAYLSGVVGQSFNFEPAIEKLPLESLEIRSRSDTLEESIVALVKPFECEFLKPHLFTYIDPNYEAKSELEKTPSKKINGWTDVLDLLESILDGDKFRERISNTRRAWSHWIEMEKLGRLSVKKWHSEFNFRNEIDISGRSLFSELSNKITTEFGRELIANINRKKFSRADLAALLLSEDRNRTLAQDEFGDLEEISSKHSLLYNRTAALQHGCERVELTEFSSDRYMKLFLKPYGLTDSFASPEEIIIALCNIDDNDFRAFFVTRSTLIRRWRQGGDVCALKRVIEELYHYVCERGFDESRRKELTLEASKIVPRRQLIVNSAIDTLSILVSWIMTGDDISVPFADSMKGFIGTRVEAKADEDVSCQIGLTCNSLVTYARNCE